MLRFGVPIQRKLGPDHPDLVILLTKLSRAIVAAGGDLDEALSLSREAAAIARMHRDARLAGGYADSMPDAASSALTRAIAGDATTHDSLSMAYGAVMEATSARVDAAGRGDAGILRNEMFVAAQDLEQSTAGQAMAEAAALAMAGEGALGALITRKQQLADRARALNLAVTASVLASETLGLEEKRAALAQVVQELAAADAQLKKAFPEFDELVSPSALSVEDVKARLAADEALILIVSNGPDYYAFAITPDADRSVSWRMRESRLPGWWHGCAAAWMKPAASPTRTWIRPPTSLVNSRASTPSSRALIARRPTGSTPPCSSRLNRRSARRSGSSSRSPGRWADCRCQCW